MDQETVDAQWPGFEVKCKKCASTLVELDNSIAPASLGGIWGGVDLVCLNCGQRVEIVET